MDINLSKNYFLMHHFARFINQKLSDVKDLYGTLLPVFLLGFMLGLSYLFHLFVIGFKKLVAKF